LIRLGASTAQTACHHRQNAGIAVLDIGSGRAALSFGQFPASKVECLMQPIKGQIVGPAKKVTVNSALWRPLPLTVAPAAIVVTLSAQMIEYEWPFADAM
jgi:hypothetical protein